MQLAQLIKRLNAGELNEFLSRHEIPGETTDPERMATIVVQPKHLNAILTELNQAQLLIVRWLAQQEKLQATWDHFTKELNGRIPEPSLLQVLNDLRMFGLVDYVAEPESGWIATYAAVASAQSISHGIDLNSALNGISAEMLHAMCQKLSIAPIPTTKAKRIEVITRCLTDHRFLVFLIASLPDESKELFEWISDRGGMADHNALAVKLGEGYYAAMSYVSRALTGWGATNAAKASPFIDLLERALVAGVSAYGNSWGYASYFAIPSDVATAYAGTSIFDTAPLVPPQLVSANPTETRLPNMTTLLRDLSHLRAFISLGRAEWRQDGEPYARSLQTLSKLISGPTKDYGSTLWKLAMDVSVVIPSGDREGGYIAADLSEARPDELIRSLIQGWSEEPINSYSSDQYLPRDTHRRVLNLLPSLPLDIWIDRESFESLLSFFWPLLFNAKVKNSNEHISGEWAALYATVLGEGRDAEKRESFLIQSAGLDVILAEGVTPDLKLPDWDMSWIVQPDRTIVAPPNAHPDSILDLWSVAELIENQGASIFRVSADSISAALNQGMTPDEIAGLFERHSRTPMPATIERVIRDQSQRYGQVRVGSATAYLEVDDPEVLDEIVRNAKLDRLDIQVIAPTVAVIRGTDDVTTIASLRKNGYLPVQATVKAKSNSKPTPIRATQTQDEIKTLLRGAINDLRLARVQWNSPEYGTVEYVMEPANIRHAILAGYEANSGEMVEMPVSSILSVRLLTTAESKNYYI